MTKLNSFLLGVLFISIGIIALTILNKEPDDWRINPVTQKFGTPPNSDATLDPIVHLLNENKVPFCTAFIVDANYAITAGHCVKRYGDLIKQKLYFSNEAGEDLNVEVTAKGFFTDQDFGLLTGDFSNFKSMPVNFYQNGFALKKVYATCGFPYSQNHLSCNAFVPVNNFSFLIRGNGYIIKGMSGGPVVDVETGVAVGVNTATSDGYVYVTPLEGFLGAFRLD